MLWDSPCRRGNSTSGGTRPPATSAQHRLGTLLPGIASLENQAAYDALKLDLKSCLPILCQDLQVMGLNLRFLEWFLVSHAFSQKRKTSTTFFHMLLLWFIVLPSIWYAFRNAGECTHQCTTLSECLWSGQNTLVNNEKRIVFMNSNSFLSVFFVICRLCWPTCLPCMLFTMELMDCATLEAECIMVHSYWLKVGLHTQYFTEMLLQDPWGFQLELVLSILCLSYDVWIGVQA